jgi:hypothetical protein
VSQLPQLTIGIPLTTAVHEYLDASAAQLVNGNVGFVVAEFDGFKQNAHVTYETRAFTEAVQIETNRMKAGPRGK